MKKYLFTILALTILFAASPRDAAAQDTTTRGQRWEKTITTGGGTYNWISTKLCVQYTSPTSQVFTGLGFWDDRPLSGGDTFKVRAAFNETGQWSWQLLGSSNPGCVATTGFFPQSGTIQVNLDVTGLPLYSTGPIRVNSNKRFLVYSGAPVLSPFLWIGDTTWFGPHRSFLSPAWDNYLTERKNDGFTVIEVSVPLSSSGQPVDVTGRKPFGTYSGGTFTPCLDTVVQPSSACFPNKAFWDYWDQHVNAINAKGMLATVIGLFKRATGNAGWPDVADSQGYARWIAARLAGNYTTLAPGFDELPDRTQAVTDPCTGTVNNQACRARAVGTAIRDAILLQTTINAPAPRLGTPLTALVTHHIGGGCSDGLDGTPPNQCLADYWLDKFQTEAWLDFQLFQSGQGGNCLKQQLACLIERSSKRPLTLYNHPTATKPIINGEAVYDQFGFEGGASGCPKSPPDYGPAAAFYGELRARQTAFNSLLSGSVGFTHGIGGTWDWNGYWTCRSQTEGLNAESSNQIGRLVQLFQPFRWNRLVPDCQAWGTTCTHVKNAGQTTDAQELKRMYSRDSLGTFAFAYLPDGAGVAGYDNSLKLDLSDLSAFTVGSPWATDWYNPRRPLASGGPCVCTATPTGSGPYTFTRPATGDWGLVIRNTTSWPTLSVPQCNPPDGTGKIPC
ncbi:MAG: hypothetical protein QOF89_1118 [Acidobacteriota bacterium]|jgi:hypothetical protein|nr:hypothetical protein [Acidobacteriota bacterium]